MTKKLISILFVMVCLTSLAHAQTYRCKSSNGSISFQDYPCQKSDTGSIVKLPTQPPSKDARQSLGNSSSVKPSSETARYPYAREGDVERLKADNEKLQAMNKRMKDENPDWQRSQTLKRLNDQAEALNKSIQK